MLELVKLFYIFLPGAGVLLLFSSLTERSINNLGELALVLISFLTGYLLSLLTSLLSAWPKDEIVAKLFTEFRTELKTRKIYDSKTLMKNLKTENSYLWKKGEERLPWHFAALNELWANIFLASLISALAIPFIQTRADTNQVLIALLLLSLLSFVGYYNFQEKEYKTILGYILNKH